MKNLRYKFDAWRIRRTRARLARMLEQRPRYWQAVMLGGEGQIPLGIVTQADAVALASGSLRLNVVTVNTDGAFIVCRKTAAAPAGGDE